MRVAWVIKNGVKILKIDFSNLAAKEALEVLYESERVHLEYGKPAPLFCDYRGTTIDSFFMDEVKRIGKKHDHLVICLAGIGLSGVKMILAKGYLKFTGQSHKIKYLNTEEEAFDFLLSKSGVTS